MSSQMRDANFGRKVTDSFYESDFETERDYLGITIVPPPRASIATKTYCLFLTWIQPQLSRPSVQLLSGRWPGRCQFRGKLYSHEGAGKSRIFASDSRTGFQCHCPGWTAGRPFHRPQW